MKSRVFYQIKRMLLFFLGLLLVSLAARGAWALGSGVWANTRLIFLLTPAYLAAMIIGAMFMYSALKMKFDLSEEII